MFATKKTMANSSDILLKELVNGNRAAFDALFKLYYPSLLAYSMRYLSKEDSENIVQDVMLYLWEHRADIRINNLQNYLFTSVRNKALSLLNHGIVKQRVHSELINSLFESYSIDEISILELTEKMEKTLGTMPREYREAFELHRFYNKSYKEIADIKNVSPKTIDYRIQQALRSLRVSLKDYVKKK